VAGEDLTTVLLSGTAGAIAAALINWWLNRRERDLALKRDVMRQFKRLHRERSQADRFDDNLVTLIKAMAKACQLPIGEVNDHFLMMPFTPRPALHSKK